MDIKELAAYLGFSTSKIYRLAEAGKIPFAKIGHQYRFMKPAIDDWLREQTMGPRPRVADLGLVINEKDPLTKRLLLIGLLTKELAPHHIRPVIVGGQAVEFYTAGGYATRDIDLVSTRTDIIDNVLISWGFVKEGRHWYSNELGISIEVPSSTLAGDEDKITVIEIDSLNIYMIGIEDIIIDRLNALVHWQSDDDRTWSKELMMLHRDDIDWSYLRKRAKKEKTLKELEVLEKEIDEYEKNRL